MEIKITDVNFKQEVLESELPVLVDFYAEWCGPCQMLAPTIESIAKEYEGKIKVCKTNIDEASDTAAKYEVMSIPTLVVFDNGKIVGKSIGAVSETEIANMIKPYIKEGK
ncbi:MAG: thioredoxin [Clostridiales bacterium]|nr:thioredoxin [bacterium]MCK5128301.1 thioredoxin [Clostridiales bacterium]